MRTIFTVPFLGSCPADTSALSTFCIMSGKPHGERLKLPKHKDRWAALPYSVMSQQRRFRYLTRHFALPALFIVLPLVLLSYGRNPCYPNHCGASQSGIPASFSLLKANTIACVSRILGGKASDNKVAAGGERRLWGDISFCAK